MKIVIILILIVFNPAFAMQPSTHTDNRMPILPNLGLYRKPYFKAVNGIFSSINYYNDKQSIRLNSGHLHNDNSGDLLLNIGVYNSYLVKSLTLYIMPSFFFGILVGGQYDLYRWNNDLSGISFGSMVNLWGKNFGCNLLFRQKLFFTFDFYLSNQLRSSVRYYSHNNCNYRVGCKRKDHENNVKFQNQTYDYLIGFRYRDIFRSNVKFNLSIEGGFSKIIGSKIKKEQHSPSHYKTSRESKIISVIFEVNSIGAGQRAKKARKANFHDESYF